jgi:hypothetical protein
MPEQKHLPVFKRSHSRGHWHLPLTSFSFSPHFVGAAPTAAVAAETCGFATGIGFAVTAAGVTALAPLAAAAVVVSAV